MFKASHSRQLIWEPLEARNHRLINQLRFENSRDRHCQRLLCDYEEIFSYPEGVHVGRVEFPSSRDFSNDPSVIEHVLAMWEANDVISWACFCGGHAKIVNGAIGHDVGVRGVINDSNSFLKIHFIQRLESLRIEFVNYGTFSEGKIFIIEWVNRNHRVVRVGLRWFEKCSDPVKKIDLQIASDMICILLENALTRIRNRCCPKLRYDYAISSEISFVGVTLKESALIGDLPVGYVKTMKQRSRIE